MRLVNYKRAPVVLINNTTNMSDEQGRADLYRGPARSPARSEAHFLDADSEMDSGQNASGHKRRNVTRRQRPRRLGY